MYHLTRSFVVCLMALVLVACGGGGGGDDGPSGDAGSTNDGGGDQTVKDLSAWFSASAPSAGVFDVEVSSISGEPLASSQTNSSTPVRLSLTDELTATNNAVLVTFTDRETGFFLRRLVNTSNFTESPSDSLPPADSTISVTPRSEAAALVSEIVNGELEYDSYSRLMQTETQSEDVAGSPLATISASIIQVYTDGEAQGPRSYSAQILTGYVKNALGQVIIAGEEKEVALPKLGPHAGFEVIGRTMPAGIEVIPSANGFKVSAAQTSEGDAQLAVRDDTTAVLYPLDHYLLALNVGLPTDLAVSSGQEMTPFDSRLSIRTPSTEQAESYRLEISEINDLASQGVDVDLAYLVKSNESLPNDFHLVYRPQNVEENATPFLVHIPDGSDKPRNVYPVSFDEVAGEYVYQVNEFSPFFFGSRAANNSIDLGTQITIDQLLENPEKVIEFVQDEIIDYLLDPNRFQSITSKCASTAIRNIGDPADSEICSDYLLRLASKSLASYFRLASSPRLADLANEEYRPGLFSRKVNALERYQEHLQSVNALAIALANRYQTAAWVPSRFDDDPFDSEVRGGGSKDYFPMIAYRLANLNQPDINEVLRSLDGFLANYSDRALVCHILDEELTSLEEYLIDTSPKIFSDEVDHTAQIIEMAAGAVEFAERAYFSEVRSKYALALFPGGASQVWSGIESLDTLSDLFETTFRIGNMAIASSNQNSDIKDYRNCGSSSCFGSDSSFWSLAYSSDFRLPTETTTKLDEIKSYRGQFSDCAGGSFDDTGGSDGGDGNNENTELFSLDVSVSGPGTISSTPAGINCGSSCVAEFEEGTSVSLTVSPASDAIFDGWSGACSDAGNTCTVSMSEAHTVSATFSTIEVAPENYTLSVIKEGTGAGTITSDPSGINCGSSCSTEFSDGASVTLTASAANDATFAGWSGACDGSSESSTCTLSMSQARSVTAMFNAFNATDRFAATADQVPFRGDYLAECQNEFGTDWVVAEWLDIKRLYENGDSLADLTSLLQGEGSHWVTRSSDHYHTSSRDYVMAYFGGEKPSSWAAFDDIANHTFSLGSWHNARKVLCSPTSLM